MNKTKKPKKEKPYRFSRIFLPLLEASYIILITHNLYEVYALHKGGVDYSLMAFLALNTFFMFNLSRDIKKAEAKQDS